MEEGLKVDIDGERTAPLYPGTKPCWQKRLETGACAVEESS